MATDYQIILADTALWSLQDAESFKASFSNSETAALWVDHLLLSSVAAIAQDPRRYRYNALLSNNGIPLRERLDTESEFCCLYYVDEQIHTIEILLFVSMKQDLEKMLYRYLLLQ